jgi:hypothetical protein
MVPPYRNISTDYYLPTSQLLDSEMTEAHCEDLYKLSKQTQYTSTIANFNTPHNNLYDLKMNTFIETKKIGNIKYTASKK